MTTWQGLAYPSATFADNSGGEGINDNQLFIPSTRVATALSV
ncbi:hypothetical protein [Proteus mirabilis]